MKILIRIIYVIALFAMIISSIASVCTDYITRILCWVVMFGSSSYILFCKSYDWLLVLAFVRKGLHNTIGISLGFYFKSLIVITTIIYVYSFIRLFIFAISLHSLLTIFSVIIGFVIMTLSYIINIKNAYKADPNEVVNSVMEEYRKKKM